MSRFEFSSKVTRFQLGRPGNRGSILNKGRDFSLSHNIQTDTGARLDSYPNSPGSYFPGLAYRN
jgi:hypothetical protein